MQANMPSADPQQAKMMLYMMPAIFTVMNVFLPAGLGVYMLTNTWLGIIQQTLTERWVQKKLREQGSASIEVREKPGPLLAASNAASEGAANLGKGKARARG
jgi:YidC/Oxa1 family membrane protein insertase